MRKIIIALAFALTTMLSLPLKAFATDITPAGGWQKTDSPEITDELKALTEKAFSTQESKGFIPVAYLARQVVAGMNHRILCRDKSAATEVYAIVTIYEDLSGGATVTDIESSSVPTNISDLPGGWTQAESPVITDELFAMFSKSYEGLDGVYHNPIALLSTQVVSGINYCFLAETGPVIPDPQMKMVFTTIYQDLEGNVSVIDQQPFSDSEKPQSVKKGSNLKLLTEENIAKIKVSEKGIVKAKKSGNKVIVKGKKQGTVTITAYNKKGAVIQSWVVIVE